MAEAAGSAVDHGLRIRKERIHTTMLIELLVLLVFLALAFAFVTKDESSVSSLQAKVDQLARDLGAARKQVSLLQLRNDELIAANRDLRQSLFRWMDRHQGTLAASDQPIVLPKSQFDKLTNRLGNADDMVKERQDENAKLRLQLAAARGGGTDLPNCPVTAGFLIKVDLYGDGALVVHPAWNPGAADSVSQVPGALALASGGRLSGPEFQSRAAGVAAWGRSLATPCGFRAQVTEHHSNLTLYKTQVRAVERYFYVRRN